MNGPIIPDTTTTDAVASATLAVLPIGSFEQHGPCLPLATDTLIACAVASEISAHHNIFRLPPITFSCSHEHSDFPGTLSVSATTLAAVVGDIVDGLVQQGVTGLIIVNAHGGNAVLTNVVQQSNQRGSRIKIGLYPSREDWTEARAAAGITSSNHDDMHAGELETSILLAAYPDYLRDGWGSADHTATDRRYLTTLGIGAYTSTGVIGYPSRAEEAKGKMALQHLAQNAHALIKLITTE
ncbi:creatininase family protein [Mycobacterium sp.]|uniref:creatininase family protein n=1 Tax=Mycobacterium sp. TaxID=1785 RepID=UPI002B76162B|nr:creatininase family protein [Mycobacterium sp.]HTY30591.1 creatininase family protein [Mycobacterium sp.]